jgi:hypothetical protein
MLPEALKGPDERDEKLFTDLLKTVYYSHRSALVHGGREVSDVSLLADKAGSSYFKHLVVWRGNKDAWLSLVCEGRARIASRLSGEYFAGGAEQRRSWTFAPRV